MSTIIQEIPIPAVLTTGIIAKVCGVAPRTATKWIDSGLLKGYRLPGSQDRRVSRAEFERFATEHNLPCAPKQTPDLLRT